MIRLAGIAGSLRKGSFNRALLRAAQAAAPQGVEIAAGTIEGIPLYDGDLEAERGIPAAVETLKDLVARSHGLIIVTPEYNNSIPGVLKNAIDWMSRGDDMERVFGGRPVALLGASPGGFGTILSQTAWLPVLRALGTRPWFGGKLMVSRAHTVFDGEGNLTDEKVGKALAAYLAGFSAFAREKGGD